LPQLQDRSFLRGLRIDVARFGNNDEQAGIK